MIRLEVSLLVLMIHHTAAAHGENATRPQTTSWYEPPNTRGTWDVLTTSVITINLCVWTAIHLNIPAVARSPDRTPLWVRIWRSHYCRRAKWVVVGLLAPELAVYTAWMQWGSARVFVNRLGRHKRHHQCNAPRNARHLRKGQ